MSKHWVVRKLVTDPDLGYRVVEVYLILEGPFAYPRWSSLYGTALLRSEAHQWANAMSRPGQGEEGPKPILVDIAIPKWRPRTFAELQAET